MSFLSATLARPDGTTIAYDRAEGRSPTVVFLHGLNSDRCGTKAEALAAHCRTRGLGFVRFDMFGHGQSSGRFEDGTISRWVDDTLAVIDGLTAGPVVLVGSSMGGWVGVRAAMARPARVAGVFGIAAAPDFTEELMWAQFSDAQRNALMREGIVELPSDYDDRPYRISRALIEDGRRNLVLRAPVPIACPVCLLHGQADASVPWLVSLKLAQQIVGDDVEVVLIKGGDHRLSRPQDLQRLCALVDGLLDRVASA
jgi:pimeloyl-ACP methyl ester carboxylesterase